jgi:hypothetical protein
MSRTTSRTAVVAACLALAFTATACGADSETAAGGSATAAPMDSMSSHHGGATASSAALQPAGTGEPFEDLRTAGEHMPMTAAALAGGIAEGAGIEGDSSSAAAEMRATLTALLTEHVYLAGVAVATAYTAGADSAEFTASTEAVDANSVALADVVGSVAPDQREAFLQSWRSHVEDFVAYAVAAKAGDEAAKQQEVADLAAYAQGAGQFFATVTGGVLPAEAVQAQFDEHIASLAAAIDALAAGDPTASDKLKSAGDHMAMSAEALTGGIVTATGTAGDPADPAAALRATLTSQLVSHTYLAGVAVFTAYTSGAETPAFEAAAAALDENSVELGAVVGSVAPDQEATFLEVWRAHIGDFVEYAVATAEGDEEGRQQQLADLDAYRATSGAFFEEITGGALPADAVAEELGTHVETLAGAIDSFAEALVSE